MPKFFCLDLLHFRLSAHKFYFFLIRPDGFQNFSEKIFPFFFFFANIRIYFHLFCIRQGVDIL